MKKNEIFDKAFTFTTSKVKEIAAEVQDAAVKTIREKAKCLGDETADHLKNKASESIGRIIGIKEKPSTNLSGSQIVNTPNNTTIEKVDVVKSEMTEEEENRFIDTLSTNLAQVGFAAIRNPAQAAEVLNTLAKSATEVKKFQELQITKRANIESLRQQALAKIDLQKSLLLTYLTQTFDERKGIFEQQFKVVDNALENGNIEQLAMGLDAINTLAASSPFKNLTSIANVGKALENPNTVWEF